LKLRSAEEINEDRVLFHIPVATVKARMYYARKRIAEFLKEIRIEHVCDA
jgi:DNA-directed RNA polymerase specialized sigma24 family protein